MRICRIHARKMEKSGVLMCLWYSCVCLCTLSLLTRVLLIYNKIIWITISIIHSERNPSFIVRSHPEHIGIRHLLIQLKLESMVRNFSIARRHVHIPNTCNHMQTHASTSKKHTQTHHGIHKHITAYTNKQTHETHTYTNAHRYTHALPEACLVPMAPPHSRLKTLTFPSHVYACIALVM